MRPKIALGRLNQNGLASIVVVAVLVVLLSLISIGFARLMSRAVNGSLNNQLSSSASYATQSALNDAIAYVQVNPTAKSTTCNGLLTSGGGAIKDYYVNGSTTYKYSCILVNPTPPSLVYGVPPQQSQVAVINTVDSNGNPVAPNNLLFSWEGAGADINKTRLGCNSPSLQLLDELTWSTNGCPPLLRLSLYPVDGSGNVAQANSRTFFLYPQNSGGNSLDYSAAGSDGTLQPVNCSTQPSNPNESTGNYLCSVVISDFSAASGLSSFYAWITPIYDQANVLIKANDVNNKILEFKGDQSLIDTTAQVGTAAKRLQARVAVGNAQDITPSENALPQDAVRTAEAICKRLDVSNGAAANEDSFCNTQQKIIPPNPPNVFLCGTTSASCTPDSTTSPQTIDIPDSSSVNLNWDVNSNPLDGPVTCNENNSTLSWLGPSGDSTGADNTGPLSGAPNGNTFTYEITCNDGAPTPATAIVNVNVGPPSKTVIQGNPGTPSCDPITVSVDWDGVPGDTYTGSVSGSEGNTCGIGISQCNSFNAGGGSLEEDDFGNGNPVSDPANAGTGGGGYIGCQAIDGTWGYSNASGSNPGNPGTPATGWISFGITYAGDKSSIKSKGVASWCNDTDPEHGAVVCGVWATVGGGQYCTLTWHDSSGNFFQETQYNGVYDTRSQGPTQPGFLLGFPDQSYINRSAGLTVACNGLTPATQTWFNSNSIYP